MPWKGEKDPYKIWLSEIILQQTKVEQGLEYYQRFVKRFPKVELLALAEEKEVYKMWEGLGYYSRCKNLIATSRNIAFEQKGKFPSNYDELLKLKGIGPYTAAAIASFAFHLPHAVVDGNVVRVLARFYGIELPIDGKEGKNYFTNLAQSLLSKEFPAFYNQAIMDFGATVCKPKLPLCSECILQEKCYAFKNNFIKSLPVKTKKLVKKHRYFHYIVAEYKDKIYVRKRTGKDIWENLWEFIQMETPEQISIENFLKSDDFLSCAGNNFVLKNISTAYRQQLTHQTITGIFIHILLSSPFKSETYKALDKNELNSLAFPRLMTNYFYKKQPVSEGDRISAFAK